jgi:hypothetical protein
MMRLLPPLTAAVAIVAAGVVHGFWTDRWTPPTETTDAAARMALVSREIGKDVDGSREWSGEDVHGDVTPGIVGSLMRRYTSRVTGAKVVIALVCGRPGPVSIHTPASCYAASGYTFGTAQRLAVREPSELFWTADTVRTRPTDETRLRLFWAWHAGAGWVAPDDARTVFPRVPVLYKLYVQRELQNLAEPVKDDPCQEFLRVFLPELDATLFAAR